MGTQLLLQLRLTDERVLQYVSMRRHDRVTPAVRLITHLGGATFTIACVLLLLMGSAEWRGAGVRALLALASSHMVVQLVKRTVCRARPCLPVGAESLIEAPDRFSFPSGHAAASLSIGLAVAPLFVAPVAAVLVLLAVTVGLTRCYLGVHYLGDVLAGWVLAFAAIALLGGV